MNDFEFQFPERPLAGRQIILAGGSGGLGSACAVLLAREGASLVIGFRSDRARAEQLASILTEQGAAGVTLVEGDLANAEVRSKLVAAAAQPYGVVCFNGDPGRVKFDQASSEDLSDSLEANYSVPLLLAREAAEAMQRRKQAGSLIFISSMQALVPFDSSLNYAGAKAALHHATRILARQWGGVTGIRVNTVAPGVNRAGMALASIATGKYDPFVDRGVVSRFGRPEDVARVVRLLLEPDNYITGQVIAVDGGLTLRRDCEKSAASS